MSSIGPGQRGMGPSSGVFHRDGSVKHWRENGSSCPELVAVGAALAMGVVGTAVNRAVIAVQVATAATVRTCG